jgi:membrane protease YdiL (CAAX protease family)
VEPIKVWVVFFTYGLAAIGILLASVVAGVVLQALDPDLTAQELFEGLRGLIAAGIASSCALAFTTYVATRGAPIARLRLLPGRERGAHLIVMIVGVLTLGETLDSAANLSGIARRGSIEVIRRALVGASGPDLFGAVVVVGVVAGIAEEVFFRGYMQSLLRERWRPWTAIVVTSVCFGALHLDPVHAALAFLLGLYLGFVVELSGSALPAVTCHVVNNGVFTLVTALVPAPSGAALNLALLLGSAAAFVGAITWLRRSMRSAPLAR